MFNHDQINGFALNSLAGNSNDASLVVGRAHRTSPGDEAGKRPKTARVAMPPVAVPRAEAISVSEQRLPQAWCRRQRTGLSGCCLTAGGQAPAAMWASLILAQQKQTTL